MTTGHLALQVVVLSCECVLHSDTTSIGTGPASVLDLWVVNYFCSLGS